MTSDQISETPLLVKGDGIYLTDKNGKTYLDAISGIAVTGVGYGRKAITAAMA
ncbi:MAG: aspartate aminotransferase family protein, partial [Deltaproteobacteria bacterium]